MRRRKVPILIIAVIVGAVVGGVVGGIIASILPQGAVKTLFEKTLPLGFSPTEIDLYIASMTFGFTLRINFVSVVGIFLAIYYFKWWFL